MTRLCAATDLSPRSVFAERRAAMIAGAKGWALTLLHAIDDEQQPAVLAAHRTAAEAALAARAAALESDLALRCKGGVTGRVILGDPSESLAQAAAGAAAIVIGPHRRRAIRDFFIGTTGERLIRAVETPVLSVHAAPQAPYRKLLLAVDGSPASAAALTAVRGLALTAAQDVTALMVVDAAEMSLLRRGGATTAERDAAIREAKRAAALRLAAFLPHGGFPCAREIAFEPDQTIAQTICDAAERLECDVIALGARGMGRLPARFIGSVAEQVLSRARIDVLAAPPAP